MFNTDQSGFNEELLSQRTLEIIGTLKVFSTIRSKHSATHSYTMQFLISADGELKAPAFMIHQENKDEFGPEVSRTMFRHKEVYVVASTSGKIKKKMLQDWFKKIYFPNAGNDSILLLDSLTTYKDRVEIDKSKPINQKYQVITIPGGITGYVQPLDVLFNRTYKTFVRRLSDHINFYHEEIKLHQRDTNIRLQTIVHHQFRSPRFNQFIRHSWIKSGLTDNLNRDQHEDDDSSVLWFDDPNGFCFDPLKILNNKCVFCPEKPCFIQCAWCKYFFCFKHFYLQGEDGFHYCEQFIE